MNERVTREQIKGWLMEVADRIPDDGIGPTAWAHLAGIRQVDRHGVEYPALGVPRGARCIPRRCSTHGTGSAFVAGAVKELLAEGRIARSSKRRGWYVPVRR